MTEVPLLRKIVSALMIGFGLTIVISGTFGAVPQPFNYLGLLPILLGSLMWRTSERNPRGPSMSVYGPMDEALFWKIIEGNRGDAQKVTKALAKLSPEQIAEFQRLYYERHNRLHRWDIWGAGYVINGGCSDDGFHYFKSWIIGKGRKAYETALAAPDDLGQFVSKNEAEDGCENESLNYAAEDAYESVTGKTEELDRNSNEADEPSGKPWEEEEVYGLYPKLAARFG